ncbi:glycosyltransferase family 4 protein [Sphingomonas sp.]|jgi:glycosyltransferase involved in cell wall biosynthesis|uniref:glycosyltransferase family 4 protein n=1 Tax=Sphingomonas sp. TaxID=28214 RepID=UPI002D7F0D28|nr:glycosyltransferase family 4 protein [Sphingomonas sp.]HEU0045789.1 glycosyltransferase family 4 protein [Sphingomonas sp.]
MPDGYVCAINRGRDDYQVPLALYEAGLLKCFVTDYYAPEPAPAWLPGALRHRRTPGLPATVTRNAPLSFALQSAAQSLRLPMRRIFPVTDRLLADSAGRVARRANAHLYCYAPHLPPERSIAPGTRRVVFEYHPLPPLSLELLDGDHARNPQTRSSYEPERAALSQSRRNDAWKRADAVVCASAMTRRSLEHDGCPPERITVIPYGIAALPPPIVMPRSGRAEFLFVGQGVQRKGLHHLIEAWQASDMSDARLTLVCYNIDPGIQEMISDPSIRLLGRQDRASLERLYNQADVFVMPSLLEGFGLVYLEALARGCHIIGTGNTGLPDLALPAEAATLIDAGDLTALCAALTTTRHAALAGQLDRTTIHGAAGKWQWTDFRHAIADHARAALKG